MSPTADDIIAAMRTRLVEFRAAHVYRTLRVDQDQWTYLTSGQGSQCIVLLHDTLGNAEYYFESITAFEDSLRVIVPSIPATVDTLERAVRGLTAILDAESIERAHVFGHAQGGMIAQAFLGGRAKRTASLILSNTILTDRARIAEGERDLAYARRMPVFLLRFELKRRLKRLLESDAPDLPSGAQTFWLEWFAGSLAGRDLRKRTISQSAIELDFHRSSPVRASEVEDWPGRVLIFESDSDTLISPTEFAALRASWPSSVVHRFQGAGHLAILSRTESYVLRIRLFCGMPARAL